MVQKKAAEWSLGTRPINTSRILLPTELLSRVAVGRLLHSYMY